LPAAAPGEMMAWSRISAESEECSLDACLERTGGACAFYAARTQAEASHVLVVNHALLMADIQSGNRVLPEFRHLIIDEGHHLEAATTSGMSVRVNEGDLARTLRDLVGAPNALLPEASALARRSLGAAEARRMAKATQELEALCRESSQAWSAVFIHLAEFLAGLHGEEAATNYNLQIRIVPALRSLPAWSAVEIAWDETRPLLTGIADGMADLADTLAGFGDGGSSSAVDVAGALRTSLRSLRETTELFERFVFKPDPGTIYWADLHSDRRRVSVHAAPLAIGPLVERHLWNEKDSIVLTSATLTTAGEFDYLKARLHAQSADEVALGSPFGC